MNVDLDVIAQRGRCEVSSLRLALPLIEQGYTPPFLARYRRDELGGLDEQSLWALSQAVRTQQGLESYREQLQAAWQSTKLDDPAIGRAISGAKSRRLLDRLGRRIKAESNEPSSLLNRLAVRVMNPQKGDSGDFDEIAALVKPSPEAPKEATEEADAPEASTEAPVAAAPSAETQAIDLEKLDEAFAKRMIGDPRVIGAAVRWLSKHAKIHVLEVSDPHGTADEASADKSSKKPSAQSQPTESKPTQAAPTESKPAESSDPKPAAEGAADGAEAAAVEAASVEAASVEVVAEPAPVAETPVTEVPNAAPIETPPEAVTTEAVADSAAPAEAAPEVAAEEPASTPEASAAAETATEPQSAEAPVAEIPVAEIPAAEIPAAEIPAAEIPAAEIPAAEIPAAEIPAAEIPAAEIPAAEIPAAEIPAAETPAEATASIAKLPAKKTAKPAKKEKAAPKKSKKISPRQRRRRWLVSTLKPLAGKRMPASKLSSFQIVMLGRALRSQVAQCAFDYDAAKLVAELQKTAVGFNREAGEHLGEVLLANEASIRDAAESAWWDEIQEQASARLVSIAAENLHRQINRGGVEAKVVMSIDAIGPRTAATAIVAADGRLLHSEDIPCQLSAAMRTLAVTKMGELIHKYHVDLIVISNGPARRACMVAVGELIKQSGEQSVRWTLADRSGADAYAGSPAGDQEMKQTPRRFRSAAWIAFSTLQPSQAMVKVDPLKLRLGSFQRELSDQAVLAALEDVLVSGASRGGVDVNSTTAAWMERLPGMTNSIAGTLDKARRESLFASRADLLARGDWPSEVNNRQALPFLRVFSSEEPLDGTLIHPDDYPLAKRLAKALEIELPPSTPPGYELPDYSEPAPKDKAEPVVVDPAAEAQASKSDGFSIEDAAAPTETTEANAEAVQPESAEPESAEPESSEPEASEPETSEPVASEPVASEPAASEPAATEPEADAQATAEPEPVAEESSESVSEAVVEPAADSEPSKAAEATSEAPPEVIRRTKPEKAKVDKLIKEWQVGVRRSYQIVNWLCEPFGEGVSEGTPPAVMTSMPAMSELKQGDQVIGVVVGVMPFGVFVELSPECSGLIHVSRISDGYVEDLHEAVQVGDVVTAWVTGIDGKRRRVGLSAVSPEREAELQNVRRDSRGSGQGGQGRGGAGRGGERGAQERGGRGPGQAAGQGGGQSRGAKTEGGPNPRGGSNQRGGSGGAKSDSRGGNRGGGNRGGARRDSRGGSRGPRQPEVYEVVGKDLDSPKLTDAMEEGKEPLRSFGDLMQLFTKEKGQPAEKPKAKTKAKPAPVAESPVAESPAAESSPSDEASAESPKAEPVVNTPEPPVAETPSDSNPTRPTDVSTDVSTEESPQ